jgi:CDP-diacylglycerol---serine O-phosphatidyltransferase
MIQSTQGHFDRAALGIVLAGLCDALDGRVARLARSTSRFGSEYDSLADVVSFGVAPAFLAYMSGDLALLQRTGWILAFLFTACAALRLARFNVQPSRYAGRFEGLPSPAAAGMVASDPVVHVVPAPAGLRRRGAAAPGGRACWRGSAC